MNAIIGVAKIIPKIPKKFPKNNKPIIIVTGCNFMVFPITTGCKKLLSNTWAIITAINTHIPVIGLIERPTITAGAPPIYGPMYGITFVTAQNNPNIIGAFRPAIPKAIDWKINRINIIFRKEAV